MIILDQEKLSAFFDTVSRGFNRSPLEIALVILAVVLFVGLLLLAYLIQRARARRQSRAAAERRFAELAEKRGLGPSERELVERMARYLKEPEKKYLILINQPTFNFCAARLRETEQAPAEEIGELRHKIGFRLQGPEQVPASSTELPPGQPVLLVAPGGGGAPGPRSRAAGPVKAQARVSTQEASSLIVELGKEEPALRRGVPLTVYFQNRAGRFSFPSRIVSVDGRLLGLAHCEQIKRLQRRKYYRKRISQRVAVRAAGTEEKPLVSTFHDLSGNGASLANPGKLFSAGDEVELSFFAGGERFTLVAEVLRTSKNGEVLHVRFAPMRESTRDRIIGSLFTASGRSAR